MYTCTCTCTNREGLKLRLIPCSAYRVCACVCNCILWVHVQCTCTCTRCTCTKCTCVFVSHIHVHSLARQRQMQLAENEAAELEQREREMRQLEVRPLETGSLMETKSEWLLVWRIQWKLSNQDTLWNEDILLIWHIFKSQLHWNLYITTSEITFFCPKGVQIRKVPLSVSSDNYMYMYMCSMHINCIHVCTWYNWCLLDYSLVPRLPSICIIRSDDLWTHLMYMYM